jgi:hypothetical protein
MMLPASGRAPHPGTVDGVAAAIVFLIKNNLVTGTTVVSMGAGH